MTCASRTIQLIVVVNECLIIRFEVSGEPQVNRYLTLSYTNCFWQEIELAWCKAEAIFLGTGNALSH